MLDSTRHTIANLTVLAGSGDTGGFYVAYRAAVAASPDFVLTMRRQCCPLPWEGALSYFAR